MSCELETQIRELAYRNWEEAGCPSTSEEEKNRFWLEAEKAISKLKKCCGNCHCSEE